ncbi:carboxypeptidase regulatory-like domain-containing protein [uncultured Pontibacter sp.]|uniref:carboxypeptidase regulatory-like domain-containing protein n=1 Tax=uncultured Pontibacter sp. TaxID=453356 RepID=UPI0026266E6D|nr:carboxypeptidase regulatory-like domain-containing protein [uncultured Pontibacter sp.]
MFKTASTLKLFYFIALFIGLASCNEDTIEPKGEGLIEGVVISAETGVAIPAASITTTPATSAIVTDENGRFKITAVPWGDYTVSAKKNGYGAETVAVAVKESKKAAEENISAITIVLSKSKEQQASPERPYNPVPKVDSVDAPIAVTLRWQGKDPDKGDSLKYDVLLYVSGSTQKNIISQGKSDTAVVASQLNYSTTYFWQVIAKDNHGNVTNGPVWTFRTADLPDARYLFAKSVNGNYDIYSSDGAPTNVFRLTNSFSREWWPVMSPRRNEIAYSSNAGIENHIYIMKRDGSDKQQVTTVPVAGYHNQGIGFAWSPDGGQLLYANYDNLYRVERDGSGLTLLAKAPQNRHFRAVDWTSQGSKIVMQTIGSNINDSEIYIMNANGTGMALLVDNVPGRVESPSFSIDGRRVIYTQDVAGFETPEGRQLDARIFVQNIDGTGVVDLSVNKPAGTNDLNPRFSPDGAKIIFVNTSNDGISKKEVWAMNAADGSNRVLLFSDAEMPDWK